MGLQKAYDALDQDRCVKILASYEVEPRALLIFWTYWERMIMVARDRE